MKVLQINATVNTGSTGRIAEGIGRRLISRGHDSIIGFGRTSSTSISETQRIGSYSDVLLHGIQSLLFDRHGFGSQSATRQFLNHIQEKRMDAIGLHNLHGYYLNIEVLFNALAKWDLPVLWTFHDCWPFTGHCTYYDSVNCEKWKEYCHHCPKTHKYPKSIWLDNSQANFYDKKKLFTSVKNLTIVTPSKWLANEVQLSFFKEYPVKVIHNGIDLSQFRPIKVSQNDENPIVLGVANVWDERKGLKDIISLRKRLSNDYKIVIIGLNSRQIKHLPAGMIGLHRTENREELAEWYSRASVFINPTYQDNFPTTNIEALACGTPVITYNTGGSPEAIDAATGIVVEQGDIQGLFKGIKDLNSLDQQTLSLACRERAERMFNQEERYHEYVELYESLVNEHAAMNP